MSDQNKQPTPSGDPEVSDIVKSILNEPMHQPRYSIKHYISNDLSGEAWRDWAQDMVNAAWKIINPLAEAPVLRNPPTLEDEWNFRRSAAFLILERDIGDYPGDEIFKGGMPPMYRYYKYQHVIDPIVNKEDSDWPTVPKILESISKDDRDMLLYGQCQTSKTPDGFGGEPGCFMQSNGETR